MPLFRVLIWFFVLSGEKGSLWDRRIRLGSYWPISDNLLDRIYKLDRNKPISAKPAVLTRIKNWIIQFYSALHLRKLNTLSPTSFRPKMTGVFFQIIDEEIDTQTCPVATRWRRFAGRRRRRAEEEAASSGPGSQTREQVLLGRELGGGGGGHSKSRG